MLPQWHFPEHRPEYKARAPIQGEYFSDEAIENMAHALVREVCQNSIDARLPDSDGPVVVRFHVSDEQGAIGAEEASHWLGGVWPHLKAQGSGLRDVPETPGPCRYLLVEDFNTTGLTGDPEQWQQVDGGGTNRFKAFFHAEGFSEKQGKEGGRWGVGKAVLPRCSRWNLLLGLTVRADDRRRLLMGQAILKYHNLNGKEYTPDGTFGIRREDGLVLPVENQPEVLDRLASAFGVRRGNNQTGLSVVIPYYREDITARDILTAALREYFYPILGGRLVVKVSGDGLPNEGVELDAGTYRHHLSEYAESLKDELRPVIDLALWARDLPDSDRIALQEHPPTRAPSWRNDMLPSDAADSLRDRFRRGYPLALRVPVTVRRKGQEPEPSGLDVYIQRARDERGSVPRFVRDGILVGQRERQVRGHRVHILVVAEDGPLATLLGDAEPPAHTHWHHETENFQRAGYLDGKSYLDFARKAPRAIAEMLSVREQERDHFTLADFFPRPPMDEGGPGPKKKKRRKGTEPEGEPDEIPESRPQPFTVEKIEGGFTVRRGAPEAPLPRRIEVRVAYDVRRGSPLKKYEPADFDLSRRPIRSRLKGVREVTRKENRLVFEPKGDDFRVEITGFDPNRDLLVRARTVEVRDEQTV